MLIHNINQRSLICQPVWYFKSPAHTGDVIIFITKFHAKVSLDEQENELKIESKYIPNRSTIAGQTVGTYGLKSYLIL